MLPGFSLVIPAFNEASRIAQTLQQAIAYLHDVSSESEIVVVDDGSTDSTAAVVRDVFTTAGGIEVRLLERTRNQGKGAAVRAGLAAATRPVALFSDADFSTPIEEAPQLLDPIFAGELDVAFGSRGLDRKVIGDRQAWHREQAGRIFNLAVRMMTGLPFWDTQCGFKAFRLDVFRAVLASAVSDGFGFDVELLYLARKSGLRMREIPVHWNHHEGSKVRFIRDSAHMLREVAALRSR